MNMKMTMEIPLTNGFNSKEKNHKWFYFSSDGYFETSSPKNAPFVLNSPLFVLIK